MAGWLPDPVRPDLDRWWDGDEWTTFTRSVFSLYPNPAHRIKAEREAVPLAKLGLLLFMVAVFVYQISEFVFDTDFPDPLNITPEGQHSLFSYAAPIPGGEILAEMAVAAAIVGYCLIVLWLYRCVQSGRSFRLPVTRRPSWAIYGFLVPLVNLWFPYQVLRDSVPADSPNRRRIKKWWIAGAAYVVVAYFFVIPILGNRAFQVTALVSDVVLVILVVVSWRMIDRVTQEHAESLAELLSYAGPNQQRGHGVEADTAKPAKRNVVGAVPFH